MLGGRIDVMEIGLLILFVIIFILWRLKPAKGIKTISTNHLKDILNDKEKVFLDVRTTGEYKLRNIRQFTNIPLGGDFTKLPKNKEIIVICQSGIRSVQACKQSKKLGYENVTNVRGGMSAWRG